MMNDYQKIDYLLVKIAYLDSENLAADFGQIDFSQHKYVSYFLKEISNLENKITNNNSEDFLDIFSKIKINHQSLEDIILNHFEKENSFSCINEVLSDYFFSKYKPKVLPLIEKNDFSKTRHVKSNQILDSMSQILKITSVKRRHDCISNMITSIMSSNLSVIEKDLSLENIAKKITFNDLMAVFENKNSPVGDKLYLFYQRHRKSYLNITQMSLMNSQRILIKDNGILEDILQADSKIKKDFYDHLFRNLRTYKNVLEKAIYLDKDAYILFDMSKKHHSSGVLSDEIIKKLEIAKINHQIESVHPTEEKEAGKIKL